MSSRRPAARPGRRGRDGTPGPSRGTGPPDPRARGRGSRSVAARRAAGLAGLAGAGLTGLTGFAGLAGLAGSAVGRVAGLAGVRVGIGHRHARRTQYPLADPVAGLEDLHDARLGHLGRQRVHERLVDGRVEGLALLAVLHQPELARDRLQALGDGLEAAVELVVLTGAADVVQHREQLGQHLTEGLLADRDPVALDALAVVVVLGLQPLEVG